MHSKLRGLSGLLTGGLCRIPQQPLRVANSLRTLRGRDSPRSVVYYAGCIGVYAYDLVLHPGKLTNEDALPLHGMGVVWRLC
jgi:hypothetical protein